VPPCGTPWHEIREGMVSVKSAAGGPVKHPSPERDVLTALVLLQDLDLMIRDATDPHQADAVAKMGFKTEGVEQLRTARSVLAAQVDPRLLRLYEAAARRYGGRALVPVANRTCVGCSAVLPTGLTPDPRRVTNCQSCGRILYPL
jgi:predicted  nucleic acid-binding Zn-ribbon protein